MDCREAEELFGPYLLGALEPEERQRLDSHLETCPACSLKLQGDREPVARLAFAVPQLEVPRRIKEGLLSRVQADARAQTPNPLVPAWSALRRALSGTFLLHPVRAMATILVLGLVLGGVWFNSRLHRVSEETERISAVMEQAAERDDQVMDMVKAQRYFTYEAIRRSATPGTSVNMLWGTEPATRARGMMLCCAVTEEGDTALLAVLNLPPLPPNKAYQVWLIKGDQRFGAGLFTVDSTGFGQTVIIPVDPFTEFDAIGITVEPAEGSPGPTGDSVLKGYL